MEQAGARSMELKQRPAMEECCFKMNRDSMYLPQSLCTIILLELISMVYFSSRIQVKGTILELQFFAHHSVSRCAKYMEETEDKYLTL